MRLIQFPFKYAKARIALLAATTVFGVGVTGSAIAATATSNADATIIQAISISNTAGLDFGSVVADSASAGTVTMSAAGTRSCTTVTCVAQDAGQASGFDVSGEASYTYTITLPASTSLSDGAGNSMTVDTFTDSKSGAGTLDGTGADSFTVGADLSVGMGQVAGTYNGTFDVTVEYN